jgi:hypothetical protein
MNHEQEEPFAMNVSTVGLDLAKNVFQVHGIDDIGKVLMRRTLRRRQVIPFFRPITSAGRFSHLGPLGIPNPISDRNDAHLVKVVLVLR